MADSEEEEGKRPVIIIKRVDDDHDDHHGGVWKIAFADFMTALMAFFLVMWLINASNEGKRPVWPVSNNCRVLGSHAFIRSFTVFSCTV